MEENLMKKIAVILVLILSTTQLCFATFSAQDTFVLGAELDYSTNQYVNRNDKTFVDKGNSFDFSYIPENGLVSNFTIKRDNKIIYTKAINALSANSSIRVIRIKDTDNGRNFYIIGMQYKLKYLMGYNEKENKWKIYVDADNYYNSSDKGYYGITIHNGQLCIYQQGVEKYHRYILTLDSSSDSFVAKDEGELELNYFDDSYNYDPDYRPLYAHMDEESYVDLSSLRTISDLDDIWIFEVKGVSTGRNSDIGKTYGPIRYKVEKSTRRAWCFDDRKFIWSELPMHSTPAGYQTAACACVNWCYAYKYGKLLGNFDLMDYMLKTYKGNQSL
jgi:hypothetical protein